MPPQIDHKKPAAAFALLCVIAVAVVGNGVRAKAADFALALTGPAVLRLPVASGLLDGPPSQQPRPSTTSTGVAPSAPAAGRDVVPAPRERADRHRPNRRAEHRDAEHAGAEHPGAVHPGAAETGRRDTRLGDPLGQRSWRHPAHLRLRELEELGPGRHERPGSSDGPRH